jgi:hypothetical protein
MEISKMLAMEPVAAAALIRALSWQFSRVFITADSQYGTSLSDSMALRCGWRSRQRGAVAECTVAVLRCSLQLAMWSWGRG